MTEAG